MGAVTFAVASSGTTADDAFRAAREEALYDSGHGGYTGTIAEKHSFVMVSDKPVAKEEAYRLSDKLIDDGDARVDDKWGPAGCIETTEKKNGATVYLFFGWASS